jgi:hypothetical protein
VDVRFFLGCLFYVERGDVSRLFRLNTLRLTTLNTHPLGIVSLPTFAGIGDLSGLAGAAILAPLSTGLRSRRESRHVAK